MAGAQPILIRGRELLPRPSTGLAGDVVTLGSDGRAAWAAAGQSQNGWTATNLTGGTLGGHRLVTVDPATGGMIYADCTDAAHAGRPIGLTLAATSHGASGVAVQAGQVVEPSWDWAPGAELFVGLDGLLTPYENLPDGRAFDRRVAVARTATSIVLDVLDPLCL